MSDYREFHDGEVVPGTRYRVTRLIGVGGMGRVYEVEHIELGKRFVLKALQPELVRREDLVARLRNEWRALARLEHPNIVGVTDAGSSESDIPFYVMERLEGEILSSLLHRQRRLIPPHALSIAAGILDGLHAAHQIGVVHRDVKPPNIFVTSVGVVKVLDFGIAKIQDASGVITARGIAVGTPRYMSPEQAQGATVDARSDIYAVGLMLFEMLSGVGPFDDAKDNNELILAQLGRPAPLLSSLSVVAPELDALVASMLAKDPRERPANAGQVAETLRALSTRYARYVDAEAPTVSTSRPPSSEPPTRVDGPRRSLSVSAPTRPDAPAALAKPPGGDTTTVQPALELATTAAHVVPSSASPAPRATLRLSGALPTPSLFGPDTQVDPLTLVPGADETAERTELLLTAAMPAAQAGSRLDDGGPTRTAIPVPAPPASTQLAGARPSDAPQLTPPPVVPASAGVGAQLAPRSVRRVVPLLALGGVVALLVAAAVWSRTPERSATVSGAASPSPAAVQVAPAPTFAPETKPSVSKAAEAVPPAESSAEPATQAPSVPAVPPPAAGRLTGPSAAAESVSGLASARVPAQTHAGLASAPKATAAAKGSAKKAALKADIAQPRAASLMPGSGL